MRTTLGFFHGCVLRDDERSGDRTRQYRLRVKEIAKQLSLASVHSTREMWPPGSLCSVLAEDKSTPSFARADARCERARELRMLLPQSALSKSKRVEELEESLCGSKDCPSRAAVKNAQEARCARKSRISPTHWQPSSQYTHLTMAERTARSILVSSTNCPAVVGRLQTGHAGVISRCSRMHVPQKGPSPQGYSSESMTFPSPLLRTKGRTTSILQMTHVSSDRSRSRTHSDGSASSG